MSRELDRNSWGDNPYYDTEDTEEDCGYELDDPKHPTFHERYADAADLARKSEKEGATLSHYEISPREREDEDRRRRHEEGTEAEQEQDAFDDRHLQTEQGQPEGWISE